MKIIIIPDIHQDFYWANKIVDLHPDFDKLVLLGDFFDTKKKGMFSIEDSCKTLLKWKDKFQDKLITIVGNHDAAYYAYCMGFIGTAYTCGGVTIERMRKVKKHLPLEFIRDCKVGWLYNKILFSHAGLKQELISAQISEDDLLNHIQKRLDYAWSDFPYIWNPLFGASRHRGGDAKYGGLTWCDLDEFEATLPISQIFGHSSEHRRLAVFDDKAFCLDGFQTLYGVLEDDLLTVRITEYTKIKVAPYKYQECVGHTQKFPEYFTKEYQQKIC